MFRDFCYLFNQKDRIRFLLLLVLMLGGSFLEMATLGAVPLFVATLLGQGDARTPRFISDWLAQSNADLETIAVRGGMALFLLFLMRTAYFTLNYAFQERVLRNRQIALGSRVFRACMAAPFAMIRCRNSSTIVNNISNETERLINAMLDPMLNLVRNSVVALTILGLLIWFDPIVSLTSFVILGIAGCTFMVFVQRRMKTLGATAHEGRLGAVKAISEGIGIFKEATILGNKGFFTARLHRSLEQQIKPIRTSNTMQKCLWPSMELLTVAVLLGAMAVMLLSGRAINSAAPTLALLTVCLARLKGCLTEIMYFFSLLKYNASVLESIASDLRTLENAADFTELETQKECTITFKDKITAQNVTFTYPDGKASVLSNISFEIAKGSSAAFVGPTGSGKSTMADLLLGLFKPDSGTIQVDGRNIFEHIHDWQGQIGFVPQDICLLDDTIRANIALGVSHENVDTEALRRAIKAASLDDFVDSLPNGDLTIVGERGTRISGGQCQRIGIARALYRNPSILVFDEATSALDSGTEAAVVSAIEKLKGTHTMIIVAHRLTTVKSCNAIYYFDKQNVEKYNSLEELMSAKPAFAAPTQKK